MALVNAPDTAQTVQRILAMLRQIPDQGPGVQDCRHKESTSAATNVNTSTNVFKKEAASSPGFANMTRPLENFTIPEKKPSTPMQLEIQRSIKLQEAIQQQDVVQASYATAQRILYMVPLIPYPTNGIRKIVLAGTVMEPYPGDLSVPLEAFAHGSYTDMSYEEAKTVIKEAMMKWPELDESDDITAWNIIDLERGLIQKSVALEPSSVRMYISLGCCELGKAKDESISFRDQIVCGVIAEVFSINPPRSFADFELLWKWSSMR